MGQRGALHVGADLLDDRVTTMGLVRSHCVQAAGSAAVKNAWKRHTSNKVALPGCLLLVGVEVRNATPPAGRDSLGRLLDSERYEAGANDHEPGRHRVEAKDMAIPEGHLWDATLSQPWSDCGGVRRSERRHGAVATQREWLVLREGIRPVDLGSS